MIILETAAAAKTVGEIGSVTVEIVKKSAEAAKGIGEMYAELQRGKPELVIGENPDRIPSDLMREIIKEKLPDIKVMNPEQLEILDELNRQKHLSTKNDEWHMCMTEGLSEKDKQKIKEKTGWTYEIVDSVGSTEEYEIYKKAGLEEAEIGGRKCLIRNDIDWEQTDALGRTNKERAEQGLSPLNKDGKVIELHHIGQHADSPLAELTPEEHRGRGNDTILHDKNKVSEIDRQVFADERSAHWLARTNEGGR